MRTRLQPTHRLSLPLAVCFAGIVACDSMTAPDPAVEPGITPSLAASRGAGGTGMVPYFVRAEFGAAPDAIPIFCAPAQAGIAVPNKYVGTGNSLHMGKTGITIVFHSCTLVGTGGIAWTALGHATQTAANGDAVTGSFAMTQFASGDFELTQFTITGGTERFATAAGTATGQGWISLTTLQGYFELTGLITRPNH